MILGVICQLFKLWFNVKWTQIIWKWFQVSDGHDLSSVYTPVNDFESSKVNDFQNLEVQKWNIVQNEWEYVRFLNLLLSRVVQKKCNIVKQIRE